MSTAELADEHEGAIAVVGMAGRFPGAPDVWSFWRNQCDGVESVTFFSPEELAAAGVPESVYRAPNFIPAKAKLAGAELFDAEFFGIAAREAEVTDPQHRIFLECAWEALESAGHDPAGFDGRVGVYGGVAMNMYLLRAALANPALISDYETMIFNEKDTLCGRVAYRLDLRGPAITVQTECSTSLVAVHLACMSLLSGECDMALAGGTAVESLEAGGYLYDDALMLSADGHCRVFDQEASGTITGSGAAVVVLRRLRDALAAGDVILGVVRGSAVNNDGGAGKAGFTAPSIRGVAQVVADALAVSGVPADSIGFVEAHGTGTIVGDPIEVSGLTRGFRAYTERVGYCALGSAKANVGHLGPAAGVTGFVRAVLAVRSGVIPPVLHFATPNPDLALESSPFYVPTSRAQWPEIAGPRRASVSSMGVGGTNAHVVIEEPPPRPPSGPSRAWQLVVVSARSLQALDESCRRVARALEDIPEGPGFADAAYTLQVGRRGFRHRRAVVCESPGQAAAALLGADPERTLTGQADDAGRRIVLLLPGSGSQYPGMARSLYEQEPLFAEQVDRCAALAAGRLGFDVRAVIRGDDAMDSAQARLAAIFSVDYALARLWMHWGVKPQAVLGHSVGEYVAACLAGVFTLEDALAAVIVRGELMDRMPEGAILSVALPERECGPLAGPDVDLAAVNGPTATVLSGRGDDILALRERLTEAGVQHQLLPGRQAAHTRLLDPLLPEFTAHMSGVRLSPPRIPVGSNLTGTWLTPEQATDPGYWARQLREQVRFAENLRTACTGPPTVFLEAGPGHALGTLAREQCRAERVTDAMVVTSLPGARDADPDGEAMLTAVGQLWVAGVPVDWDRMWAGQNRARVTLPTYPFQRQRYSLGGAPPAGPLEAAAPAVRVASAAPVVPTPHDRPSLPSQYVEPRSDLEASVAAIWADLFGYSQVGVFDDFLLLGGDSLQAGRLAARLREAFPVSLPVKQIFEMRTVARQAAAMEELLLERLEAMSDQEAEQLLAEATEPEPGSAGG